MEKMESGTRLFCPSSDNRSEALRYNNEGHRKYLQVDFDDAISDYTKAIDLDSKLAVAYYNRGVVYYRLGHYDMALRDLEKSVDLEPRNQEFLEGLEDCRKMCQQTENSR